MHFSRRNEKKVFDKGELIYNKDQNNYINMSNISADKIKLLRDKTGAGIMDCKNALS